MENYISLSELNLKVKEKIEAVFFDNILITAEINEIRENNGHAYLELIEKDEADNIRARARAVIWANTYGMLKPYFETSTGHRFKEGIKILISVKVSFHEVYGYSLNITDIEPSYTIGEIEKKRLEIIKRLEEEGVTEMNKELDFPLVPQRIAIISSDTAAGYGDFINQINKSPFYFKTKLFKATMQGEETESSVINALEKIFEEENNFDLVVIIRGGGAKSDLSWFDSYGIAVNIAQFPLPVLTGIGHKRDKTISDTVAYMSLNTPTAVAEFLTDKVYEFFNYLESLSEKLYFTTKKITDEKKEIITELSNKSALIVNKLLLNKKNELELLKKEYKHKVKEFLSFFDYKLEKYPERIKNSVRININNKLQNTELLNLKLKNSVSGFFEKNRHILNMYEQKNNMTNPENILKKGYSYTLKNGKLIKSDDNVKNGDYIETVLYKGKILSVVKK